MLLCAELFVHLFLGWWFVANNQGYVWCLSQPGNSVIYNGKPYHLLNIAEQITGLTLPNCELAKLNSDDLPDDLSTPVAKFLVTLLGTNGWCASVGIHRDGGIWRWSDGTEVTNVNWAGGFPTDIFSQCVQVCREDSGWVWRPKVCIAPTGAGIFQCDINESGTDEEDFWSEFGIELGDVSEGTAGPVTTVHTAVNPNVPTQTTTTDLSEQFTMTEIPEEISVTNVPRQITVTDVYEQTTPNNVSVQTMATVGLTETIGTVPVKTTGTHFHKQTTTNVPEGITVSDVSKQTIETEVPNENTGNNAPQQNPANFIARKRNLAMAPTRRSSLTKLRVSSFVLQRPTAERRVYTLTICSRLCVSHDQCMLFNYSKATGQCRLFRDTDVDYEEKDGWSVWRVTELWLG